MKLTLTKIRSLKKAVKKGAQPKSSARNVDLSRPITNAPSFAPKDALLMKLNQALSNRHGDTNATFPRYKSVYG